MRQEGILSGEDWGLVRVVLGDRLRSTARWDRKASRCCRRARGPPGGSFVEEGKNPFVVCFSVPFDARARRIGGNGKLKEGPLERSLI